jgi:hypothetical protein
MLHALGGNTQQHAVVSQPQNLDRAIGRHAVNDYVPGLSDTRAGRDQPAGQRKWVGPHAWYHRDIFRAYWDIRTAQECECGKHQAIITLSRTDAKLPGAFSKDVFKLGIGRPDKAVCHLGVIRRQIGSYASHCSLKQRFGISLGLDQDIIAGFSGSDPYPGDLLEFFLGVQVFGITNRRLAKKIYAGCGTTFGDLSVDDRFQVVRKLNLQYRTHGTLLPRRR